MCMYRGERDGNDAGCQRDRGELRGNDAIGFRWSQLMIRAVWQRRMKQRTVKDGKKEKQAAQMHREIVHGPMLCKKSALPASLKE